MSYNRLGDFYLLLLTSVSLPKHMFGNANFYCETSLLIPGL